MNSHWETRLTSPRVRVRELFTRARGRGQLRGAGEEPLILGMLAQPAVHVGEHLSISGFEEPDGDPCSILEACAGETWQRDGKSRPVLPQVMNA